MSNDNSPENFAKQERAVIVAPAGYGKTELIAQSVAFCKKRQLVLTHTHAGVDSLRRRIKEKYQVPSSKYYVETIHSFALRFAGSYPKTTGLDIKQPQEDNDYDQIISSAIKLFDTKLGKDILKASVSGIFVDEYQDCMLNQHDLICKLAKILPCRIVGDPLQGIYDFGNNEIVDWDKKVFRFFEQLPDLTIPYRWLNTRPELGERLKEVRQKLETRREIHFTDTIPANHEAIVQSLYHVYNNCHDDRIFVVCKPEPRYRYYPHTLAKSMNNLYHTIEPLTSKDLCVDAQKIDNNYGRQRLKNVISFCKKCLTRISRECGRALNPGRKNLNEREVKLKKCFQKIEAEDNLKNVYDLFLFFERAYNPTYKRKQLWEEMKNGLHEVFLGGAETLEDAVWNARNQLRFKKNRIPKRCISRTVLLKGLECEHAVIIKPELFDKKNLYVALTRATSKITIISNAKSWSNYT